jgi:hypothetical protein
MAMRGLPEVTIFDLFTAVLATAWCLLALRFDSTAKVAPLVIGVPTALGSYYRLVADWRRPAPQAPGTLPAPAFWGRLGRLYLWIGGFFLAVLLGGYLVAIPLFVALFLRFAGKEPWPRAILVALVMDAVVYGFFGKVVGLVFPSGMLSGWWGS